jgi:hypothetical protein
MIRLTDLWPVQINYQPRDVGSRIASGVCLHCLPGRRTGTFPDSSTTT